ncbi:MAG: hypothetical protein KF805_11585 [Phycisphaeraceae bacterium]|nr:hypothetical protein [Phycisphaeraceae bacterium]
MRKRFSACWKSAIVLSMMAGIGASSLAAGDSFDPLRKGAGENRVKLTSMERKPFDWSLLGELSDWKNGTAPSAATLDGKVVLIVTYSDWYRPAARALAIARKAAETYGADGLVVIAAHNPDGWKDAAKPEAPAGTTMLLAHDEKGNFRKSLLSVQDPNFYLVDRAGQLRFADIANESVEEAIQFLVSEKRDDAANINQRAADARRAREVQDSKTASLNNQNDLLRNLPELSFTAPTAQEYTDANWPKLPTDERGSTTSESHKITLPNAGWSPAQPPLTGRATLLYFWNPGIPASYEQMQRVADLMQRQHQRDLVVVGVLSDFTSLGSRDDKLTDEERAKKVLTPETALKRIQEFQTARRYDHAMVVDLSGSVLKTVTSESEIPLPYVAVVSSDGMTRWWGFIGSPQARGALDRVLEVDPGIQARRKAESEYLRNVKGGEAVSQPAGQTSNPPKK